MKYIKNITNSFFKNGFNASLLDIEYNNLSILLINIDGERNNYCMLDESTMFYYIIDGNGIFEINNEKFEVKKDDLIEIPPKNKYSYEGKMNMLEIQSQAFDESEVHEFSKE